MNLEFSKLGGVLGWQYFLERKAREVITSSIGDAEINVKGAARGKPGHAGIGGVLCDYESHNILG